MKMDFKEFLQSCIHCIISRHRERIPRPLSSALHGVRQNEVAHADLLYMGPAEVCNIRFVLIIKCKISTYTWLCPGENADSDAVNTFFEK